MISKVNFQAAKKLATSRGFGYVRHQTTWHGFAVYFVAVVADMGCYGWPDFILVKDGKARMATHEECGLILEYMNGYST